MTSEAKQTPKRRGRPPAPEGTSRNNRLVTFVTDGELECINAMAEASGYTVSKMVYCLLRAALSDSDENKYFEIQRTAIAGENCDEI